METLADRTAGRFVFYGGGKLFSVVFSAEIFITRALISSSFCQCEDDVYSLKVN